MTPRLLAPAFALALASIASCQSGGDSTGAVGELCTTPGNRCATPTCSDFPTNPGCDDVDPIMSHCPLDHSHCFDPTASKDYCGGTLGVCFNPKVPYPAMCPARICTKADVEVCNTVDSSDVFCRAPFQCVKFDPTCAKPDMGMTQPDAGTPMDMSAPKG